MFTQEQLKTCSSRVQSNYQTLLANFFGEEQLLQLSLIGIFSVGKSSLLNALLDDKLLPVSIEEKTTQSTLLCYTTEPMYQLVSPESTIDISKEKMQAIASGTLHKEEGILTVGYPAEFLQGIQVFDLPGIGGNDPERTKVMEGQVEMSDVIFYLISIRGPSAEDIKLIQHIISNGKTIYVIINGYDDDLDLDIETYKEELETVGYREQIYLTSALKKRGLEPVKKLIQDIVSKRHEIRQHQFTVRFQHLLKQELQFLQEEKNLLQLHLSDDTISVQRKLNEQRAHITQFKEGLREAKKTKWNSLSQTFTHLKQQELSRFQTTVQSLHTEWLLLEYTNQNWNQWIDTLKVLINESTSRVIEHLPEIDNWFDPSILSKLDALDIPPPYIPELKVENFRDAAKIQELQIEIDTLNKYTSDVPEHNIELILKEYQEKYQLLRTQHTDIMNTDIPMIEERYGIGSTIGGTIGHLADIATLFINPTTTGTKVASWLGKGGKLSTTIINAGKTAQLIQKTDSIKKASTAIGKAVELSLTMRQQEVLSSFGLPFLQDTNLHKQIQKSGVRHIVNTLNKLSFGYWGKKIGGIFDQKYLVEDPTFATKKAEELQQLQTDISSIQTMVETIQYDIFKAEGDKIQQRSLQIKLEQKQKQLEQKSAEMKQWYQQKELEAQTRQATIIRDAIQQSLVIATNRFEARLLGLENEFHKCFTQAYNILHNAAIQERIQHYDAIEANLQISVETKRQHLDQIHAQIILLQQFKTS